MKPIRAAAALAASSIVVIGACTSATGRASPSPASAMPAPATAAPATAAPTTAQPSATANATATAAETLARHSALFAPPLTIEAPPTWRIVDDSTEAFVFADAEGTISIVVQANPIIASDAKECEGLAEADGATSVNGIVASISMNPKLVTFNPHQVTIDGGIGQVVDIGLDPEWVGTCSWSGDQRAALVVTTQNPPGPFYGLQDSERARLIFLDVGEDVVMIAVSPQDAAMFDTLTPLAMPIAESVRFTR